MWHRVIQQHYCKGVCQQDTALQACCDGSNCPWLWPAAAAATEALHQLLLLDCCSTVRCAHQAMKLPMAVRADRIRIHHWNALPARPLNINNSSSSSSSVLEGKTLTLGECQAYSSAGAQSGDGGGMCNVARHHSLLAAAGPTVAGGGGGTPPPPKKRAGSRIATNSSRVLSTAAVFSTTQHLLLLLSLLLGCAAVSPPGSPLLA